MTTIESTLIIGTPATSPGAEQTRIGLDLPDDTQIGYMVMETRVDGVAYYCCWSGGYLSEEGPMLSEVGQGAIRALTALPLGSNKSLFIQELKLGQTPLQEKVIASLQEFPPNSKVCFLGDLADELDGHMHPAFNLCGAMTLDDA